MRGTTECFHEGLGLGVNPSPKTPDLSEIYAGHVKQMPSQDSPRKFADLELSEATQTALWRPRNAS